MKLRILESRWTPFINSLCERTDVESAGIILAERLHGGHVLLARHLIPLPAEGYIIRRPDQLRLDPVALNRIIHPARDAGLSGADYKVLHPLSQAPDGLLRAREICTEIGWDRSRLSHHLTRMEKRGLVTREECSEDARGLMVRLTDAGRKAIEHAAPNHADAVRRSFFDLISKKELETLASVFDRVLDHLTGEST